MLRLYFVSRVLHDANCLINKRTTPSIALALLCSTFAACQSVQPHPNDLHAYLQQFIGHSAEDIQAQLDLHRLGYQSAHPAKRTATSLSYTVIRPVSIPIPDASAVMLGPSGVTPIHMSSGYAYYPDTQSCQIRFILSQHIAQSVQFQGKAC